MVLQKASNFLRIQPLAQLANRRDRELSSQVYQQGPRIRKSQCVTQSRLVTWTAFRKASFPMVLMVPGMLVAQPALRGEQFQRLQSHKKLTRMTPKVSDSLRGCWAPGFRRAQ